MSSAPTDCRVPDPTDAKADGNFGTHRAGYGDRLDRIIATARKGWTLAAGEGLALVQEIDRLRGELELVSSEAADAYHAIDRRDEELAQQSITLSAEYQQAERILAALREPSEAVVVACAKALRQHHEGVEWCTWEALKEQTRERMMDEVRVVLSAAVAAAEQEVGA